MNNPSSFNLIQTFRKAGQAGADVKRNNTVNIYMLSAAIIGRLLCGIEAAWRQLFDTLVCQSKDGTY